ncbi:uncharacterized protein LOC134186182 [Corticium candelabrum]|uniref:uncharacterized protein LOC134186182 n=1 Tax=Corticium candelabrum TaxID=121492 RepID=UPI002E26B915|nr:uncharacterized protein LOC134186182 [Corticium candelabrum]
MAHTRLVHWMLLASMLLVLMHCSRADEYGQGGCGGNRYRCRERVSYSVKASRYKQTAYREQYHYKCGLFGWGRCPGRTTKYRSSIEYYTKTTYRYQCRPCNIDCRVNSWSSWTCAAPCCAVLNERRTRNVQVSRSGSGRSCPSIAESRTRDDDNKACYIDGRCYRHLEKSPNGCNQCQKDYSRNYWKRLSEGTCDDGNNCTANDKCQSGCCIGKPYRCLHCQRCNGDGTCGLAFGCVTSPSTCGCSIGNDCYRDGQLNPDNRAQMCDYNESAQKWSNVSAGYDTVILPNLYSED